MSRPRPSRLSDATVVASRLRAAGCVFAEEEAALLLSTAAGPNLESLVVRRVAGEPLEHLLGWVSFAGDRYVVTPGVFVPRRRSELLVLLAVEMVRDVRAVEDAQWRLEPHKRPASAHVVELCCGAGAIAAAIAARVPGAEVWAADVDQVAVACARRNLPPERVREGDLYDALPADLRGTLDVVVVNAPYVPTDAIDSMPPEARDHEPRTALDGGADGLDLHRRVFAGAGPWLAPGGAVVIETSRTQSEGTVAAARAAGLSPRVESADDLAATAVVATAGKNPGSPYAGPL